MRCRAVGVWHSCTGRQISAAPGRTPERPGAPCREAAIARDHISREADRLSVADLFLTSGCSYCSWDENLRLIWEACGGVMLVARRHQECSGAGFSDVGVRGAMSTAASRCTCFANECEVRTWWSNDLG